MKLKFTRIQRLVSREQFQATYREGNRFIGEKLIAHYKMSKSPLSKLGITISRKWGKAHDRNRFKRVVREAYRKLYAEIPSPTDLNIHPKASYQTLTVLEVQKELKRFIRDLHDQTQPESKTSS